MLKTGIYKIDQLKDPKNLKTIFGRDKKISITLYHEVVNHPELKDLAENILLNFTDERGAFKRTYSNRFEDFDQQAIQEIKKFFSPDEHLIIHDAAVSDGRTAYDFFQKLESLFPQLTYYASDYDPHIFVLEDGQTKVVLNREGIPLEITCPPFVFNLMRESFRYPLNHFIRFILERTIIKKMILKYKKGLLKAQERLLVCPQVLTLAKKDPRFHLLRHNLLTPFISSSRPFNVFRAMNILNPGYFSESDFKTIISHIFNALPDNGLFVTGSNQDSNTVVHGGIFQKAKNKFNKITQSGEGSPVEPLILSYKSN